MTNIESLRQLIADGYINVQKHPAADLYIYNYAPKAQYERFWNEWTLACRGLIMDGRHNIVARPFGKFFNVQEHPPHEIPNENFEVFEKMDGSLGILYWLDGQPLIATRGSFGSEQSQKATRMLHNTYAHTFARLDPAKTYLFEIIYPGNRIVVDYGDREDLVLLAVIDNKSGNDENLPEIGFPLVRHYDGITGLDALKTVQEDNKEGFVIRFKSGFRVKVKFEEYVRLHRILTQVSSTNIWEYLATNQPFEEILEKVPDEFYDWVKKTVDRLTIQYQAIETEAKLAFKTLADRKETALYFQTQKHPSILFAMLDNRNYAPIIWKMLKPAYEKPFRVSADE